MKATIYIRDNIIQVSLAPENEVDVQIVKRLDGCLATTRTLDGGSLMIPFVERKEKGSP